MSFSSAPTRAAISLSDAAFGLWPLARTWRTFPGARLTNGQGQKAVPKFAVA